jgi:tRNA-uridine 2-sulfurtransferase
MVLTRSDTFISGQEHGFVVMSPIKAICLFSGGLDSILATKLILDQKIEVEAVTFTSHFGPSQKCKKEMAEAAEQLGVRLKVFPLEKDYLRLIRNPKYGYGKNMNPCVDCRIFMLKKAKKYAQEIGAAIIFTGEVLDERPMSQRLQALRLVEEQSGLKGKLLRPLSAKLLPKTLAEKKGLVDREKLLGIRGRSRKPQIKLAMENDIKFYPTPAGGCLLTCEEYAKKLRDLFKHKKRVSMSDVALLSVGRHFRFGQNKIIVGRNEEENHVLTLKRASKDYYFEVPALASPTTLLQGAKTGKAIKAAAAITAYYSDSKDNIVTVSFGREQLNKSVSVSVPREADVKNLRVGNC